MKAYIAFSRLAGQEGGAILVIANTVREARRLAWQSGELMNVDEWIDLGVKILDAEIAFPLCDQNKLKQNISHVIGSPKSCEVCEFWGCGIDDDLMCRYCGSFPGDALIRLYLYVR